MPLTKKFDLLCNRCGKVVAEVHGNDGFPHNFKKVKTIEKHSWEDWFLEILCLECVAEKEKKEKKVEEGEIALDTCSTDSLLPGSVVRVIPCSTDEGRG